MYTLHFAARMQNSPILLQRLTNFLLKGQMVSTVGFVDHGVFVPSIQHSYQVQKELWLGLGR